ncbi:hypothetical protein LTR84_002267 [Exophiala bonariae]|uniref:NACHT domain-containing protein n=1 Tax=Exophiala bonariae TaxID=1690606 RepID=A0AAV9NAT5_9EURO|nr:hypothetical protein LTR84_002267 [Exophiala bonariae]
MASKRNGEAVSMVLPSMKHDNSVANPPLESMITKEVRHILTNISQKSTKADLFSSTASTSSNKNILTDMEELIHKVADSNMDTGDISRTIDKIRNTYARALRTMSERLEDSISARSHDLVTLADKVDKLTRMMESETMPQRKVLDRLYYAQMDERRNRVSRAHLKTFQWLFRHKSEDDTLWDDFLGWLFSLDTHTMYWIRGKAGSRKSTLMRELDQKIAQQRDFHEWTIGSEALHASSYLWNAGSVEQKSLTGLLLSLVHQLFQQRADLVEHSVTSNRWQIASERGVALRNWSDDELKQVLKTFARQACPDAKILFLVDGLDEYDGDDQERLSMIAFLEALAAEDGVKICVSSRPWVIYKDAFKFCPQLWLEELTKGDISLYVHDHLLGSQLFRVQQQRYPKLLTNIADEIIQKAAGVFLWVRLVVQELLKRLRDGAFAAELLKQLHAIPPDLDDYFMRMMETIDQRYRQDASIMLQIALHRMDFTFDQTNPDSKHVAGPDLLLLHLKYLDDEEAPNFVNSKDFRPLRYDDDEEVSFWIETLD